MWAMEVERGDGRAERGDSFSLYSWLYLSDANHSGPKRMWLTLLDLNAFPSSATEEDISIVP